MPNYRQFEGVDLISDRTQEVIAKVLVKNELGGFSNGYQIDHAGTSNSGFSFGGNQMDLSVGNSEYNNLFRNVITSQMGQDFYNSIVNRITQKGNSNLLTQQEENQINSSLSSDYGRQLINQAFVNEVANISQKMDNFANLLGTTFTDDVKVALADYDNQFNISFSDTRSVSMRTKLQNILNQNREITLSDVEDSIRSTGQYQNHVRSQESRIQETRKTIESEGLINDGSSAADSMGSSLIEATNQNNGLSQEQNARSWFETVGNSLTGFVDNTVDFIADAAQTLSGAISNSFSTITNWIGGIFSGETNQAPAVGVQIDNSLLNLTINTDLTSDFRSVSDPTQTGNVIDGGDYSISGPIENINGDGVQNTVPWGIVSDQLNPARQTVSPSQNFATELRFDFARLDDISSQLSQNNDNQIPDVPHIELQNPMANITNQAIDARTFINIDPVILDLNNNNAIDLISYQDSQVTFDVDNDNRVERTGWVRGSEGILVHDKNGDGIINNITETISEYYSLTDQAWQAILSEQGVNQSQHNPFVLDPFDNKYSDHGLDALSKLDTNGDDIFDGDDVMFDQLKVWQDLDEDGVTDSGELRTLSEAEVREFDLSNILEIDRQRNEGNVVLAQASFTTIYDQTRLTQAVDFTTNPIGYEFNDVNLGTLATAEDGTKSLAISNTEGETVTASQEVAQNIFGNAGDDVITGDGRDNMLSGGGGSDSLNGGAGDDILIIDEFDLQQNIDGGDGRDIVIINSDRSVSFNLAQANVETAVGGNGDDVLISGGTSNVFIDGGSGDDVIIGGAADDALSGSDGDDLIDGGYGDDVIRGHRGNDVLIGGEGDDLIDGGLDDDRLSGNEGTDILIGGKGNDIIDGGEGYDLAKYSGSYNNYQIYKENGLIRVRDLRTQDIDSLENIEGIRFDDVTIRIEENTAPLAVADQILVDGSLTEIFVAKADLLANDIDLERGVIDIRLVENAVGGQVEMVRNAGGEITGVRFTPDQNFSGVMSFDYSIIDDQGAYSEVTLHNNDGTSQQADHKARVQFKLNDDPMDPLYYDQWYLSEINVKDVWDEYKGDGVTVGVFEDGDFNRNHQDLDDNILASHAVDQEFRQVDNFSQHKTTVAGVIAAEDNNYGIIGIAPNANLDGYSWNPDQTGLANLKNVDVANNSWGVIGKFADNFFDPSSYNRIYARLLEESVREGRDGLGTVNVFAGGNERQSGDNVNYHNLQNSRFVIATGSINQEGDLGALVEASTPFSNPGSAILVSAPGSNIQSTGNLLENANGSTFLSEFSSSQGTSFSAPIISGIVALMLEANPNLGYRDVQKILAYSARKFEDENTVWRENGADNFNGGSLHYSEDYGFGIVDAKAAVRLSESWDEINNYYNEEFFGLSQNANQTLNDNGTAEFDFDISNSNMHNIENVEVLIDISHDDISQLKLILTSPDGTRSVLMDNPQEPVYDGGLRFNFSSRHFLGEEVDGRWTLQIIDNESGEVGTLRSWELKFYGKLDDGQDDVYIYTNEIATLNDGSRGVIIDNDGGIDTINAVAVNGDNVINLNPGTVTTLNGRDLAIASNTFNAQYYAQEAQLSSQSVTLENLESQLQTARNLVVQKESELVQVQQQIPAKFQEYQAVDAQFQTALSDFNQASAWFDNHVYDGGRNIAGSIFYYFIRQNDGVRITVHSSSYDDRVADYNVKLSLAQNLQSQRNNVIDEYNALLARSRDLPQEIQNIENQAEDIYQQVQDAQRNVQSSQDFLDSFNNENNTIIENAYSGDGDDRLIGNDQDNRLMAGRGENILTGGEGRDLFIIKKGATSDVITDFVAGQDRIDVSEFETSFVDQMNIVQNGSDVLITMDSGQEIILRNINQGQISQDSFKFEEIESGTDGNDIIQGTNNDDLIDGGDGNDLIQGFGGNDVIYGGDGDDRIYGGNGNDIIFDGDGKDVVDGGDGNDIIHIQGGNLPNVTISGAFSEIDAGFFGGRGDDTFVIAQNAAGGGFLNNLIYDFEVNNPNEKIDLSAFTEIDDVSDLSLGNITINGQRYTRVTIPDQDSDFTNNVNFTLKDIARDQLSNNNFIFSQNDAPIALNDSTTVRENHFITIDILANDSDDKSILTRDSIVIVNGPANGSVTINQNGTLRYRSNQGFDGIDEIEYYVIDEGGLISDIARVSINVEFVNSMPVASVTRSSVSEDGVVAIDVLAGATDIDGDVLTIDSVTNGANGSTQIVDGRIVYTPNDDFYGEDTIEYAISDGRGGVTTQSILITVNQTHEIIGTSFDDRLSSHRSSGSGSSDGMGNRIMALDGDDEIYSSTGNGVIYGGNGNDFIMVSSGSNTLFGGRDNDIFAINYNPYNNNEFIATIGDLEVNNDLEKIDLRSFSDIRDFDDLNISQIGNDSVITLDNNARIILNDVTQNDLTADNFVFYSNVISGSGLGERIMYGSYRDFSEDLIIEGNEGDDHLIYSPGYASESLYTLDGGDGEDELDPRIGDAILIGGNGNDRFIIDDFGNPYAYYFGSTRNESVIIKTINDFEFDNSQEKIVINSMNVASFDDLILTQQGDDVLIELGEDGNQIILRDILISDLSAGNFEINFFNHSPNSGYSGQFTVIDGVMEGTETGELIHSYSDDHASEIYGFGGDDNINSNGYETNIYGGDGNDSLFLYDSGGFGSVDSGQNQLSATNFYGEEGNDRFVHYGDNGYVNLMDGGNGDDYFEIRDGNPILIGGSGNDYFEISRSPDSVITIRDFEINNILEKIDLSIFKEINNLQDLNLEQNGLNTIVNLPENQRIILENVNSSDLTIEDFILVLSNKEQSGEIIGTSGYDIINGYGGDDIIDGQGGSDIMKGGSGIDNFVISYDPDTIDKINDFDISQEKIILRDFFNISQFSDLDITYHKNEYDYVPEYFALINLGNDQIIKVRNTTQNSPLTADNFTFVSTNTPPTIIDNNNFNNNFLSDNIFLNSINQNKGELPALENIDGRQVSPDPISNHVMTVDQNGEAIVTFKNSVAGYKNAIGWYKIDSNGEILDPQLLFKNAKLIASDTQFSLGNLELGTKIGFFLISDGGNGRFVAVDGSQNISVNNMDLTQGEFSFVNVDNGAATIFDNSSPTLIFTNNSDSKEFIVNKHVYHSYNNVNLNPDGQLHGGAGWDGQRNQLLLGFEDLYGGGDRDYNDILFYLTVNGGQNFRQSEYINSPSINIGLSDDNNIQKATLEITNAQNGDRLIFDNNYYIIDENTGRISRITDVESNITQDLGIVIRFIGDNSKVIISGDNSANIYQDVINSIKFINVSGTEDSVTNFTRNILIEVTDEDHASSAIQTQIIVTSDPIFGSLNDDLLIGTDSNDLLIAKSGDDILQGGLGDDSLIGGADSDTYIYNIGDGNDVINGEEANDGVDILRFGDGILRENLIFDKSLDGNDLVITFKNNEDGSIVIKNQFENENPRIENIIFENTGQVNIDFTKKTIVSPEDTSVQVNLDDIEQERILAQNIAIATTLGAISYDENTGILTYDPQNNWYGIENINYDIRDSGGNVIRSNVVNLLISPVNDRPTGRVSNYEITVGDEFSVNLTDLFSDVEDSELAFLVNAKNQIGLPDYLNFDEETGVLSGTAHKNGKTVIEVTASDSGGEIYKTSFNIAVNLDLTQAVINLPQITVTSGSSNSDSLNSVTNQQDLINAGDGDDLINYVQDAVWQDTATEQYFAWNVYSNDLVSVNGKLQSFDSFDGGVGNDTLNLTNGNDVLFLDDPVTSSLSNSARLSGIEVINGGLGDDIIDLSSLNYEYGDVTLNGEEGDDVLWSNAGDDVLNGGAGNDNLQSGTGDDVLNGGEGNDTLKGYDGDDILTGGLGSDILIGGFGFDSFNFNGLNDSRINSSDLITDFTQGEDSINFSNLGFVGIKALEDLATNDNNILGYSYDQALDITTIEDLDSDFALRLSGRIELGNEDFNFG